ncbi:tetratricopeptide repeat protein [Kangiella koreensis]|uniref:TPR repeat-containing protein n=1 Tax=Kangiella koreensis (strain DSM 16069 / JCM 12317 / KCTC 12182 / SW-125) TaxID=523791 RepID=C7RAW4_KANKD|nr:tetratricopeptide repeat protein [Kangiella koreensis]ACV26406.1 TPR repeat-containing protein [Kangiella koreensis DSM 16069]
MVAWITLTLIVLVWAAWLFGGVFKGSNRKLLYVSMLLVSGVLSLFIYFKMGAHAELEELSEKHQSFAELNLVQLANKAQEKEITALEFLTELRLRSELEPDNKEKWLQLGQIFLRFGEYDEADQAFVRAIDLEPTDASRLQVAQYFLESSDQASYQRADRHIGLVLMEQPNHEGALLMQGVNQFKQQNYQAAIDYWQRLLEMRETGSQSAQLMEQQIARAEHQLKLQQTNNIRVFVDNLSDLPLEQFSKAFVIVRSYTGGPPVAVRSVALAQLEEGVLLTPSDVMLPDVDLWQAQDVLIEIRLSVEGIAQPGSGDVYGRTEVLANLTPGDQFHIELNQTVN